MPLHGGLAKVFGVAAVAGGLALVLAVPATEASAENIFDFLFGGFRRQAGLPDQSRSYADPSFYPGPANPNIDT